uniref:Uncharacterized protein n=1 Tax=Oryza rufipogon TaxID=4529 RepID=A0A0E0N2X8_ORYRU
MSTGGGDVGEETKAASRSIASPPGCKVLNWQSAPLIGGADRGGFQARGFNETNPPLSLPNDTHSSCNDVPIIAPFLFAVRLKTLILN